MRRRLGQAFGREDLRQANRSAVFTAIHERGPISRSQLARELRLSAAAVTDITSSLVSSGLVYEAEQGEREGAGRKPILLRLDYDFAYAVGVKVSNVSVTTALTNLEAEVVAWREDLLDDHGVGTIVAAIESAVEELRRDNGIPRESIVGVGVNLPGIVDSEGESVRVSPLLGWVDVPISSLLRERLGYPALAENDVNALATAAAWFGPGKGRKDFLVLTLGRGVGLGIVVNGTVYRGTAGGAGEFGHCLLPSGREWQSTGDVTIEQLLSDAALLKRARELFPTTAPPTADDLAALAEAGDERALSLYREAGEVLGRALANLVNIFAPPLILLGGEGMRAASFLLPTAQAAMREHSFGDLGERIELIVHSWGEEAWAQGAAGLVASRFLHETAPLLGGDEQPDPAAIRFSTAGLS